MKILIIESIWVKPHLETAGEIALDLKKKKQNISFAWVGTDLFWNEWDIPRITKVFGCNINKKIQNFEKILSKQGVDVINDNYIPNIKKIRDWSNKFKGNISNLKKFKYKNLPLGMGVASSLISFYNNKNPNLNFIKSKVKELLCTSAYIYEQTNFLLENYKPKKIFTFNNRFASALPIVLAAKRNKIEILRHDRGAKHTKYYIYKYDINDPRNFKDIKKIDLQNKKKLKIAKNYFHKKFSGSFRDEVNKNFTQKQIKNLLPILPERKKIITYYTSTEYEQEAYINLKYKQSKVFKTFYECINKLKNVHLVIRVHPSLSKQNDYNWMKYKGKNVTVVSSISKIDTYALMKKSDLVCGYSSRIVLESAYLNIPTISFKDFGWPKNIGILYGEEKKLINKNLQKALNNKIKFDIKKILYVSYFYSTYGIKYKYYKSESLNKGKFLGFDLEWKSELFKFLEKFGIKKIYFKIRNIYNQRIIS